MRKELFEFVQIIRIQLRPAKFDPSADSMTGAVSGVLQYCTTRSPQKVEDVLLKGTHARDFHRLFLNFFASFSH
jgi:hypothetical protein